MRCGTALVLASRFVKKRTVFNTKRCRTRLRSYKKDKLLIGAVKHQITGSKLPSKFSQFCFTIFVSKINCKYKCKSCYSQVYYLLRKSTNTYKIFTELRQKACDIVSNLENVQKTQDIFEQRRQKFVKNSDNLFDITHADALQIMKTN